MIRPYVNPRPRPELAWLLDAHTVADEHGQVHELDRALACGLHVWAEAEHLRALVLAGEGACVLWRRAPIAWSPDKSADRHPVRAIDLPIPAELSEVLSGLRRWRDWLCSYGAAPAGSLGGSGMSLVKATLEQELWTNVGETPPIRFTLGGRQQDAGIPRHLHGRLRRYDIQAAYARTLGRVRYGGQWQRLGWREAMRKADPDYLIFVRARVRVPELHWWQGPLPVRPRRAEQAASPFWAISDNVYPVARELQGTWTREELMQAERSGCRLRILDAWIQASPWRPFAPWLEAVEQGRRMHGFAGLLAKVTGNATWGQFAIAKGRREVKYLDRGGRLRYRLVPMRGGNPSQRAFDLAEHIAGGVRARLHAGIMAVGDGLIAAHTDGLWTSSGSVPDWRLKERATELRLLGAQSLAYRSHDGPWAYTVAGELDPVAGFEKRWQRIENS